ncbi:dihydrofolate reductase [Peptacetobacter hominis]|uniref:Dihydrofolate reductase n=1 Tax=Peptacetobacter hominis TaxID=2743610 RepID=A0A544QXK7_9FIRM|nr:phosphoglycerate dehydrogenase [Peptacetobacter hominis]TQQ85446.1 dihydrofolate reductase [Peptacetobacter hominis]
MKLLMTRKFDDEKMKMIEDLGYEIVFHDDRILKNTEETDSVEVAYIYYNTDKIDYTRMKNLKFVQLASVGFDHIPKEYFEERGIILSNNKGGYSIPIAEYILMGILECYKNVFSLRKMQSEKIWKYEMNMLELSGKRALIMGTGDIGKETAKRLKAFDVEVWGLNTDGRNIDYFDRCFKTEELDGIIGKCDIVVGLMPSTKKTYRMMNEKRFELMKEGAVFVNAGRGSLVDTKAIEKYAPKFRGVVLDVFEEEPLYKDSPLWNMENVIITPHNSWVSEGNNERLFKNVYSNLKSYIETGKPATMLQLKKGY